jgi:uncharacterized protein YdaU (DUF1376 family)
MSIVFIAFYPSDWLAGTRGLSDSETGVYVTLISRMYEMAGPIERDDERMFRLCGCKSKASFVKSLEHLISVGKVVTTNDGLFNERVKKEIAVTMGKSSKAKAAAEARWARKPNKNNVSFDANASSKQMQQTCQPKPEPESYMKDDTYVSSQVTQNALITISQTPLEILCGVDGVKPAAAKSFIAYRRRHKSKELTETAANRLAKHLWEIFNSGGDPTDALGMAEERGWASVQTNWYFNSKGSQNGTSGNANSGNNYGNNRGSGPHHDMVAAFAQVAANRSKSIR